MTPPSGAARQILFRVEPGDIDLPRKGIGAGDPDGLGETGQANPAPGLATGSFGGAHM